MKRIQYEYTDEPIKNESIKLNGSDFKAELTIITGKEFDHWVVLSPSLNVSGYGKTIDDAKESFNHNMEVFAEDLFSTDLDKRVKYIKSLGWKQEKYFGKKYSKAFVDHKGILQNLEMPQQESLIASY
ncbi:MAG: hypothetical protein K8R68_10830 [Bacteroidales bacterium]|nr:hypothetical protein [Bacteroidales bacterium]